MLKVGAHEARDRLAALLAAVEQGEEVIITRRGRPVARLVSAVGEPDRARAMAAMERMDSLRQGVTLGRGVTIKELIEEGRR